MGKASKRITAAAALVRQCAVYETCWGLCFDQCDVMAHWGSTLCSRHVKEASGAVAPPRPPPVGSAAARESSFPALWVWLELAPSYSAAGVAGGSSRTFFASTSLSYHSQLACLHITSGTGGCHVPLFMAKSTAFRFISQNPTLRHKFCPPAPC